MALIITDGQPSISETDWKKIQLEIGSNNPGWAIFSFGISHASPQEELRRVSNLAFLVNNYSIVNNQCRNILKYIGEKFHF